MPRLSRTTEWSYAANTQKLLIGEYVTVTTGVGTIDDVVTASDIGVIVAVDVA
jgi:hypothetical protein